MKLFKTNEEQVELLEKELSELRGEKSQIDKINQLKTEIAEIKKQKFRNSTIGKMIMSTGDGIAKLVKRIEVNPNQKVKKGKTLEFVEPKKKDIKFVEPKSRGIEFAKKRSRDDPFDFVNFKEINKRR